MKDSTMKISVQLYSLRNVGNFEAQLALAREGGFEWVESVATHDLAPREFTLALQRHGLRLSSMHASLEALEDDTKRAHLLSACEATGCPLIVMPWLPMSQRAATAEGWRAMGERLAGIGRGLAAHGVRLAYHNHDFEFLAYEGRPALEWLFSAAPASDLGWEADMGWLCRAGQSPLPWVERLGGRLAAVHTKDIAPDTRRRAEDGWCAVGAGIVGWGTLLPVLAQHCPLFVFEHDNPADPLPTLQASQRFMQAHLG